MTKTVKATFDGKVYVPEDTDGVPAGTKVVFTVDVPPTKSPKEALEVIRGMMSREEAERRLKQLYEWKASDVRLRDVRE